MNKAIQYREDGKFYGLVNVPEEPPSKSHLMFDPKIEDYNDAMKACIEAGKEIINPEVLSNAVELFHKSYAYLSGKSVKPGDIFPCPDNIEFIEQATCLEKCDGECGECEKLQIIIRLKLKEEVTPVETQDELWKLALENFILKGSEDTKSKFTIQRNKV